MGNYIVAFLLLCFVGGILNGVINHKKINKRNKERVVKTVKGVRSGLSKFNDVTKPEDY